MAFRSIIEKAKRKIDERGGTDALKADAQELKNIAKGPGSASEKAKRAKDAVAEPGAGHGAPSSGPASSGHGSSTPASPSGAEGPASPPTSEGPAGVGEQSGAHDSADRRR